MRGSMVFLAAATMLVVGSGAGAAAVTSSKQAKSPLVGEWRTGVISQADAETTLRRHGLSSWITRFRRETPFTEPMALILVITPTAWDLYGKPNGKPRVEIDFDARYAVTGHTVEKTHSTGFTTLGWSVKGRKLTLRWRETTEPRFRGIPDKVFQYALYMTQAFSRAR